MAHQAWGLVLLLAGTLLTPGAAARFCDGSQASIFCDDFQTNQGWTASGQGMQSQMTYTGWSYNANDWRDSVSGCGDARSKYVGVQAGGTDLGYLSPQPFGYFTGPVQFQGQSIPTQTYARWYEVDNTLRSPMVDATGKTVTTIGFDVRGSSEDTSGVAYDRLMAYVELASGARTLLGSYSGHTLQASCNAFSFPAPYLSGQRFQFVFIFRQDSNTDSTYLAPCSAQFCPQTGTPVCTPAPPSSNLGSMCLEGGMGWYVDNVYVRRPVLRPVPLTTRLQVCGAPVTLALLASQLLGPPLNDVVGWAWDFGDTFVSDVRDPVHTFQLPASYPVTLTATLLDGSTVTGRALVEIGRACPGTASSFLPLVIPLGRPVLDDRPRDGVDATAADADADSDGVTDRFDDCPQIFEARQFDLDGDGRGDACDADRDGDGIGNEVDACPDIADVTCGALAVAAGPVFQTGGGALHAGRVAATDKARQEPLAVPVAASHSNDNALVLWLSMAVVAAGAVGLRRYRRS